jgi:hypothetical protein
MAMKKTAKKKKSSAKLGSGARFAALEKSLSGKVSNPAAVAASIGRKKYGAKKFAQLSAAGRKRAAKKKK